MEKYDVRPFRKEMEKALESGHTLSEMRRRIDFMREGEKPDTSRLARLAGIKKYTSHGIQIEKKKISEENALLLCKALDLDPVDYGL